MIYTKTGDDGTTGLFGGQRVSKADLRIDCYGTVDELNAALGFAFVSAGPSLQAVLRRIQNELFVIGSHLAAGPKADFESLPRMDPAMPARLEAEIDAAEAQLPRLRTF